VLGRPDIRPYLDKYLPGSGGATAIDRAQLMKLLWDAMVTERIVTDERDDTLATWLHVSNLSHDIAFFKDPTGSRGRVHHVAYFYGSPQHLTDVVELMRDDDSGIELGIPRLYNGIVAVPRERPRPCAAH